MALHDPTFFLPGELMKDPAQARANLAIHRFATVLRNKHHVILALPARMRQALPRFCHTVLLRICQQAILGGLYSRIAQSSSSRTRRTSGLPPLESYALAFWLAIALSLFSIVCVWRAAPRKVRVVAGQVARLHARRHSQGQEQTA